MSEPILQAKNISLVYKPRGSLWGGFSHTALNNISIDLYRGETLGILGRNGGGKSTLLSILAGIVSPSSGKVICQPKVSRALLTLGLGFMSDISGRENAIFAAMLQGMSRKNAKGIISEVENFCELGEFFDQPVRTYSSGMKARLGFATAMYTRVDILLIDEVLSVGDLHFRKKAEDAMKNKLSGTQTCVFVSHNTDQINNTCTRAIWIDNASIRESGATAEVAHKYNLAMLATKPQPPANA